MVLIGIAVLVLAVAVALVVVGTRTGTTNGGGSSGGTSFTDPTNHFSAMYHDKPTEQDQSTPIGARTLNEVLWSDTIDSNQAEIVGYADFPADFTIADPHNALDGSVNGEVNNTHGSLVTKTFGTYQGFQSVDAVISVGGSGYAETRAVLAGRTLYIVVVTSTDNPPPLFSGFANSLHILNHAS